mmetsp:Transcript_4093/g.7561  ORF Transcript_4093/g.7561 Transcript_4093/m.7561 type:complete len:108 (+) Transcript_4093:1468-1791(+)
MQPPLPRLKLLLPPPLRLKPMLVVMPKLLLPRFTYISCTSVYSIASDCCVRTHCVAPIMHTTSYRFTTSIPHHTHLFLLKIKNNKHYIYSVIVSAHSCAAYACLITT